ncbi:hypothetical protein Esti_006428 [Eimeria stiedai]
MRAARGARERAQQGLSESLCWRQEGPPLWPPCHPHEFQAGGAPFEGPPSAPLALPSLGYHRKLFGSVASPVAAAAAAAASPAAVAAEAAADSFWGHLVTLVSPRPPRKIRSFPKVPPEAFEGPLRSLTSGCCVCLSCGHPEEGRWVCVSYKAWTVRGPLDFFEGLSGTPPQQTSQIPTELLLHQVEALQSLFSQMREEALTLLHPAAAPPLLLHRNSQSFSNAPAAAAGAAAGAAAAAGPEWTVLRLKLHAQTLFQPLWAPLSLFRSFYRRLLFPPTPKRSRNTTNPAAAAAGGTGNRCCCCSSEEEYSGADDPDTDPDDSATISSRAGSTESSSSSSSSASSRSSARSSSGWICSLCLKRRQARAARSSRQVLSSPCGFYFRRGGAPGGPPLDIQGTPTDGWEATLQFSLLMPDGSAVSTRQSGGPPYRSLLGGPPPVCTYSYTLGEGVPLCPGVDVSVRGLLSEGGPVDLWLGPPWGAGSLEGGTPCYRGPLEEEGPQARTFSPGLAAPGLLGKPLYFKGLTLVSAFPPASSSSSSSSSRLVTSQALRQQGNAKLKAGEVHAALRLYQRAEAALGEADPLRGGTAQWACETILLNKALALLRLRRWQQALKCTDQVLQASPFCSKAFYRKAKALAGLRLWEPALSLCAEAELRLSSKQQPSASDAAAFKSLRLRLLHKQDVWLAMQQEQQQEQQEGQQQQQQEQQQVGKGVSEGR